MLDDLDGPDVSRWVQNLVVLLLWLPLVLVLLGVAAGVLGVGVHVALTGDIAPVAAAAGAVDPMLAAIAAAGGLAYLYLILANVTFGTGNVEAAVEQSEEIQEQADDDV